MRLRSVILIGLALGSSSAGKAADALTCDPASLDAMSYRLTTRAQASIVTQERHDDLNLAATRAAERALEIDPRNRMAHAILARQLLVLGEAEPAERAWRTVLESGGAVAWTGTLYDVDPRTYFFLVFDRERLRIYTFEQMAGSVKRGFYGIPEFPGADNESFWAAAGGCVDPSIRPEAEISWSDVRELKAGNWVLWFKLTRSVRVSSDRTGNTKQLREIKVALHGRTEDLEVYKPIGEDHLALRGRGPAGFQDLVRRTLVSLVDPQHRIQIPPLKPGVGW